MAKITVTDDLGNKLHTFSIPDEKYLSAISHIAHHFHFVPGQMEPNPEYQPEFIDDPEYNPEISKFIPNPEYDINDPESCIEMPNPEWHEPLMKNPLYDPAIPISTEITEGLFAWKQFERWVEDIAKTDIYNEAQEKLRASIGSFDAGAKVE